MSKFPQLACILFMFTLFQSSNAIENRLAPAPLPSPQGPISCGVFSMFKMSPCLAYAHENSQLVKPDDSCCLGLMESWKFDSNCVCDAFTMAFQVGFRLNVTRAIGIPSACGFKDISIDTCLLESIMGSPATPARPMKWSDMGSYSRLIFFGILINLVVHFMM